MIVARSTLVDVVGCLMHELFGEDGVVGREGWEPEFDDLNFWTDDILCDMSTSN